MSVLNELARSFYETHSFKWDRDKGFTLASGYTSPFYVDCRALMAHPSARRLVGQLAHEALIGAEIDCLGGVDGHRCTGDRRSERAGWSGQGGAMWREGHQFADDRRPDRSAKPQELTIRVCPTCS